jgi:hypothetical protein
MFDLYARQRWLLRGLFALISAIWLGHALAADETAPQRRPVKVVAPERIKVKVGQAEAIMPAFTSRDLGTAHPEVTRAVIVVHGRLRDADKYYDLTTRAAAASGASASTVIVAPQFLSTADAARHNLEPGFARWNTEAWLGGEGAKGPFPLSSFEVLDAIIARLADRNHFPHLERIVIAAHSGGAQVLQRYAVVGRADQVLAAAGLQPYADGLEASTAKSAIMRVRYVVANPSSYLYFDATRPHVVDRCPEVDRWRYGVNDPVAYVRGDMKGIEQRYLTRRVIYLLGGADVDPNHSALDKSCMAEAQGVNRLERGNAYFAHVQKRARMQSVVLRHTRVEVPGVAHDADRMFNSVCGRAALFDAPGCELRIGDSMVASTTNSTVEAPTVVTSSLSSKFATTVKR